MLSSSADLVRRIQAGDPAAEGELVERYGEPLTFLLRRWTRDPATAEDLRQETLTVALRKIRAGEVREPERLAAFLRSLARNLSTDHYRRAVHREVQNPAPTREEAERSRQIPASDPDPLHRLLTEERRQLARRVLRELPTERDRQVLLRYYFTDEESGRIRDDLGLSEDHFYRVLSRARKRYRRLFENRAEV